MDNTEYTVCQAITPSDSATIDYRAFMVNVAGNVVITDKRGNASTLTVLAGVVYRIAITKVASTSTTATGIFGLA